MANSILRFWQSLDSDDPFEPFFVAAPILMHSIDDKGVLMRVSRFWADKLGYEPEDMIGRRSTEFLTPESQIYATEVVLPEFFRTGSISNVSYDFVRKNGAPLPVLMSAIAEYDAEGTYKRSLAIMFDNSEAQRVAHELQQKSRMDAIGQLVGGVAHDFNNLLAVVQGNLEFLEAAPDDPDRAEFIASALNATRRGGALTQQLLSYGRKSTLAPIVLDLNEVVGTSDRLVRRLFPANITFETVTGGGLWKAEIDPALLETAILNILNNARDAMPNGGRITIETRNVRIDDDYVATRAEEIEPGRYVMLAISDTGTGIAQDVLNRIFEPFFTTKGVVAGSGLGLSMVYGFVRQSKGAIRAYSEIDVGTTFKLYFPALAGAVEAEAPQMGPTRRQPEDGTLVLLVEDEDEVRRVIARQLLDEGLRVVQCTKGDAALRELESGLRPNLLLTDIVMPGSLQGPELAQKARQMIPDLRALFISGYPTEAAIHGNGLRETDRHLIKPVSRAVLMRAVIEVLGED